jgi:hypothetical protein
MVFSFILFTLRFDDIIIRGILTYCFMLYGDSCIFYVVSRQRLC